MERNGNILVSEPKTEENQNQVAGSATQQSIVRSITVDRGTPHSRP